MLVLHEGINLSVGRRLLEAELQSPQMNAEIKAVVSVSLMQINFIVYSCSRRPHKHITNE